MKNIIKEVIIMILLLIVLILVFGIAFYDYIPSGKIIPNKVNYETPTEIAKELKEFSVEENAPLNIVYEVQGSDMAGYNKGKVNPYATLSPNNVTGNNTVSGDSTSGNTGTSTNTNTNTNTTNTDTTNSNVPKGTFFENGTTK